MNNYNESHELTVNTNANELLNSLSEHYLN